MHFAGLLSRRAVEPGRHGRAPSAFARTSAGSVGDNAASAFAAVCPGAQE